eukprot:6198634-Amphidinium_carterae.1
MLLKGGDAPATALSGGSEPEKLLDLLHRKASVYYTCHMCNAVQLNMAWRQSASLHGLKLQ